MMKTEINKRVSNLKELQIEKLRLQSQMDYSKEMLSENLSLHSLKNTALNSMPNSLGSLVSSGLSKTLIGRNKGVKAAIIGFLIPIAVPHISRLIMNLINKRNR